MHHCVKDFPEIGKKPGIGDPEVGNPDSVNRRTLPIRRSSRGAGQTVNGGEIRSHSFLTQVKPKETTATSDVDSKKKRNGTIAHSPPVDTNTNDTVT